MAGCGVGSDAADEIRYLKSIFVGLSPFPIMVHSSSMLMMLSEKRNERTLKEFQYLVLGIGSRNWKRLEKIGKELDLPLFINLLYCAYSMEMLVPRGQAITI